MKNPATFFALFILLLATHTSLFAQVQWGNPIYGDTISDQFGSSIALTADGKRMAVGASEHDGNGSSSGLVRVYDWDGWRWEQIGSDIYGSAANNKSGTDVAISADGTRLVIGAPFYSGGFNNRGQVRVYEWNGTDWVQMGTDIYGTGAGNFFGEAVSISADGNRIAAGAVGNSDVAYFAGEVRVFEWNGTQWAQLGPDINGPQANHNLGKDVALSEDGSRIIAGAPGNGTQYGWAQVYEWDNTSWNILGFRLTEPRGIAFSKFGQSVSISADGNLVAGGDPGHLSSTSTTGSVVVYRWSNGAWRQQGNVLVGEGLGNDFGFSVALAAKENMLAVGAINNDGNGTSAGKVKIFRWTGNLWSPSEEIKGDAAGDNLGYAVAISSAGDYLVTGAPFSSGRNSQTGQVKTHLLTNKLHEGYVYLDVNKNCALDSLDTPYANVKVLFEKDDFRGVGFSDNTGRYALWLDTGTFKANAIPTHPYRKSCTGQMQITLDSSNQASSKIEFLLQDSIESPYLTVDISAAGIRRCFNSTYRVEYCNHGTKTAPNVLLEIYLDPYLSYKTSIPGLTSQVDNLLMYQLDSLQVGACRSFIIVVGDDCKSERGQIHCTSAHIYPDSVLMEHLPNVKIDASCKGDTLIYDIQNRAAGLPHELPYLITEGLIVVDTGSVLLLAGQHKSISYFTHAREKVYQFVLAPEDDEYRVATTLYGCQDSAFTTGGILYSPQYNHPYFESDCQPNRGSYDPNDKQVFPGGSGPDHHITPDAPLEYMIRFQNTGTDTAYFINILDTLTLDFDLGSLQPGVSSHPYRMEFLPPTNDGRQVLKFTFDPILLPDSGANQEGSNGFVKYQILMKKNLPLGTRIENSAAIYFDYNDPVITNTTFLTIHLPDTNLNNGSTAIEKELSEFGSAFNLYPNPTDHTVQIDLGEEYHDVSIKVSSLLGQVIYTRHFTRLRKTKLELGRAAGIYLVTIQTVDGRTTTTKVVKKGN